MIDWMKRGKSAMLAAVMLALLAGFALTPVHAQEAAAPTQAGDPIGATTGKASDVLDGAGNPFVVAEPDPADENYAEKKAAYDEFVRQSQAEPLATKLADSVGQNRIAINLAWMLLCGFLVMFMQAGFAMVETGLCRAKNAAHVIMTNFLIYPIGMIGFWAVGFALMFGSSLSLATLGGDPAINGNQFKIGDFGLFGTKGFFLGGAYDIGVYALFLFQMVFMDTTATIPTGAMAERWKFKSFVVYGFFVSMFLYPIYGHWVWGGGWLAMLGQNFGLGNGVVDFAGCAVVHMVGGWLGLAGALVLGPRLGKYNRDGSPNAIPGHHLPMALIGAFILAFGWFGFNAGSTFGASGGGNLRIAVVATNTMLASAGGALIAALFWSWRYGKPDPSMSANGMLAGLVSITSACAFVPSWAAVLIGGIGGALVCIAVPFIERRGVDDPVGAVAVHGVCGFWGLLALGIFADGTYGAGWNGVSTAVTGLLYGGTGQFFAQLIAGITAIIWAFGVGYLFFWIQNKISPIRSAREDELQGLDLPEMGAIAYPEFQLHKESIRA